MKNFLKKPAVKGFLIGVIFAWFILFFIPSFLIKEYQFYFEVIILFFLTPIDFALSTVSATVSERSIFIISIIFYGLIGALSGFLIGKIKIRKSNEKNY